MREKTPLPYTKLYTFRCWFWDLKIELWGLEIEFVENYFFLENYVTSEGVVSHNAFIINNSSALLINTK